MKHIFIVTYGRTGSTLLQGLLNAVRGVCIFGENLGLYYYIYCAARAAARIPAYLGSELDSPRQPFYGASRLDPALLRSQLQTMCRKALHDLCDPNMTLVTGFKDTRYDMPDLEDYLTFLGQTFDQTRFIFLQRPIEETLRSGFWAGHEPDAASARISFIRDQFKAYQALNPDSSIIVNYEDIKAPCNELKNLFNYLDLEYDEGTLWKIVSHQHSYAPISSKFFDGCRFVAASGPEVAQTFAILRIASGERLLPGDTVSVSGIALVRPALLPPAAIIAVPYGLLPTFESSVSQAEIGLGSPGIARRYPNHPGSASARFRISLPARIGIATLFAVVQDGFVKIGDVFLHDGMTRTFV